MVADDLTCCLADFGLVSVIESNREHTSVTGNTGTTPWLAPELMRYEKPDKSLCIDCQHQRKTARDIYAFACTVFEVCLTCFRAPPVTDISSNRMKIYTGTRPFTSFTAPMIMYQVLGGIRPQRPSCDSFPEGIWHLVELCWAQEPLDRPTALHVCNTLKAIIEARDQVLIKTETTDLDPLDSSTEAISTPYLTSETDHGNSNYIVPDLMGYVGDNENPGLHIVVEPRRKKRLRSVKDVIASVIPQWKLTSGGKERRKLNSSSEDETDLIRREKERRQKEEEEELQISMSSELRRVQVFLEEWPRHVSDWADSVYESVVSLQSWGSHFGTLTGVDGGDTPSETFEMFLVVLGRSLKLANKLRTDVRRQFIEPLTKLSHSIDEPKRLVNLMDEQKTNQYRSKRFISSPTKGSRTEQTALLREGSESYFALRRRLLVGLPIYMRLVNKGLTAAIVHLVTIQQAYLKDLTYIWSEAFGDMIDTESQYFTDLRKRWEEVDRIVGGLKIIIPVASGDSAMVSIRPPSPLRPSRTLVKPISIPKMKHGSNSSFVSMSRSRSGSPPRPCYHSDTNLQISSPLPLQPRTRRSSSKESSRRIRYQWQSGDSLSGISGMSSSPGYNRSRSSSFK